MPMTPVQLSHCGLPGASTFTVEPRLSRGLLYNLDPLRAFSVAVVLHNGRLVLFCIPAR